MKLLESLYILQRYRDVVTTVFTVIYENGYHKKKAHEWTKKEEIHYFTLYTHVLMDVKSYMDEYNDFFFQNAEQEFKDRIITVKKIAKPAMDRLKEWKGIGDLRNHMIAHNWRVNSSNEFVYSKLGSYNTPRTFQDLIRLQFYLSAIQAVIDAEFHEEGKGMDAFLDSLNGISDVNNGTRVKVTPEEFQDSIREIIGEINHRAIEHGRKYYLREEAFYEIPTVD